MPGTRRRRARVVAGVVAALALLAGCAGSGVGDLRVLVPTEVGGGYDLTARTLAAALADARGDPGPAVFTVTGGGGAAALARLQADTGDPGLVMVMGLGLLGAMVERRPDDPVPLGAVTPLARLVSEPNVVAVRAGSPLRSVPDLAAAWRADPRGLVVAGVSERGGPDWLVTMRLAAAVGVDPAAVTYRSLPGDALLPALLRGEVDVAATGLAETAPQVDAGSVRALAVTSERRSTRIDAPSLRETGVDLAFANWRGLLAPAGLSDADRAALLALVADLRRSRVWRDAVVRNGWTDAPLEGPAFADFLTAQTMALRTM